MIFKMASMVKDAPEGFSEAVELLNSIHQEDLMLLGNEVTQFLQYKIGAINVSKWKKKMDESKNTMDNQKVQNCVNALIYIYRSAAHCRLSVEQFKTELSSSMVFSDTTQSSLCSIWSTQGSRLVSPSVMDHIHGFGQLIDIQWKVGVAMCSDSCRQLNSPFVTLALTVADAGGNLKTHSLELTMEQFRTFTKQLRDIGRVMEMV